MSSSSQSSFIFSKLIRLKEFDIPQVGKECSAGSSVAAPDPDDPFFLNHPGAAPGVYGLYIAHLLRYMVEEKFRKYFSSYPKP